MNTLSRKLAAMSRSLRDLDDDQVLSLDEAGEVLDLSIDSLKRHHSNRIVDLSPRRRGMTAGNVRAIARGE